MQKLKNLQVKGFIVGWLCCILLSGITVFAAARTENIQVTFSGIRLVVNGELVTPRDGAGNEVEPFIWNGTTYLPVRAVAQALGQEVGWDGDTQTVSIGQGTGMSTPTPTPAPLRERQPFTEVSPNSRDSGHNVWNSYSVVINGTTYNNALNFRAYGSGTHTTTHNLNGQFTIFDGFIGLSDGVVNNRALNIVDVTMNIIGDGRLLHSQEIFGADPTTPFSVNVTGVESLRIEMVFPRQDSNRWRTYSMIAFLQ